MSDDKVRVLPVAAKKVTRARLANDSDSDSNSRRPSKRAAQKGRRRQNVSPVVSSASALLTSQNSHRQAKGQDDLSQTLSTQGIFSAPDHITTTPDPFFAQLRENLA